MEKFLPVYEVNCTPYFDMKDNIQIVIVIIN